MQTNPPQLMVAVSATEEGGGMLRFATGAGAGAVFLVVAGNAGQLAQLAAAVVQDVIRSPGLLG